MIPFLLMACSPQQGPKEAYEEYYQRLWAIPQDSVGAHVPPAEGVGGMGIDGDGLDHLRQFQGLVSILDEHTDRLSFLSTRPNCFGMDHKAEISSESWLALKDSLPEMDELIGSINTHLISALWLLSGRGEELRQEDLRLEGKCDYFVKVEFDPARIPEGLRAPLFGSLVKYLSATRWLGASLAYETPSGGVDTYEFKNHAFDVVRGTKFYLEKWICGGGCFPGDALLKTEDGTITFAELAQLQRAGELPLIASFDENTNETIFQQPTKILDHGLMEAHFVNFSLIDEEGEGTTLTVTDNHRLLVLRGADRLWLPAGDVVEGDFLLGEGDESLAIDWLKITETSTVDELYNMSFSSEHTGLSPTYLVSFDGQNWVVAHNVKI